MNVSIYLKFIFVFIKKKTENVGFPPALVPIIRCYISCLPGKRRHSLPAIRVAVAVFKWMGHWRIPVPDGWNSVLTALHAITRLPIFLSLPWYAGRLRRDSNILAKPGPSPLCNDSAVQFWTWWSPPSPPFWPFVSVSSYKNVSAGVLSLHYKTLRPAVLVHTLPHF